MMHPPSRRQLFKAGTLAAITASGVAPAQQPSAPGFRYCLNTATLQGYKLGIVELVETAAKAGFQAIEPWLNQITQYVSGGGSLADLRKRIADRGLTVESAIAFPQWLVNDPAKRSTAFEQARKEMDLVAQIGGKRIAAPPSGVTAGTDLTLLQIAERYRTLLELGDQSGAVPELEFWGQSANLHTLAEAAFVIVQVNHPKACVLPDVYHLYKGGSGSFGIRMLSGQAIQVLHMNDYPSTPARETITDRDRVFPGDGVAPLQQILGDLHRVNPTAVLSLEVFNPEYWKGDPLQTAKTGLAKMKTIAENAHSG